MNDLTRYLNLQLRHGRSTLVNLTEAKPFVSLQKILADNTHFRYSPIFPAYLVPDQPPPRITKKLTSLAFFFSRTPHKALGAMKLELNPEELDRVYFTQGLASVLCINCDLQRARELKQYMDPQILEYWAIEDGQFDHSTVVIDNVEPSYPIIQLNVENATGEVAVYVEQILAAVDPIVWTA